MATFGYEVGIDYITLWAEDVEDNDNVKNYSYFCRLPEETTDGKIEELSVYTFKNLTPNTTYVVNVFINYNDRPTVQCTRKYVTTLPDDSGGGSTPDEYELVAKYNEISKTIDITLKCNGGYFEIGFYDMYVNNEYVDYVLVQSSNSYNQLEYSYSVTSSGTYNIYVEQLNYELVVVRTISADTVTVKLTSTSFDWDNPKVQGESFNLTAKEWNRLTAKINEIRDSKALSSWGFTEVYGVSNGYTKSQSTEFTAVIYNEVVDAINNIPGYRNSLSDVEPGDPVTAKCLNDIKDIVNKIIKNG